MNADSRKDWSSIVLPPRLIDVKKFTSSRSAELKSLSSVIEHQLSGSLGFHGRKRRRTGSFDDRFTKSRRRKRPKALQDGDEAVPIQENGEKTEKCRRHVRRRNEFRENPKTGFTVSGDGCKRLRTHVWHAKRFTMVKRWGFHLPILIHGRGRGSRAVLKKFRNTVLVHDASYYTSFELEGPQDLLSSTLSEVLLPFPPSSSLDGSSAEFCGITHGSAMLHSTTDIIDRTISPVTWMWGPISAYEVDGCTPGNPSPTYRAWVWLHPSVWNEGYEALQSACQKKTVGSGVTITCSSLEGRLGKLELFGPKSFQLIQKVLRPIAPPDPDCDGFKLNDVNSVASGSVIPLTVCDPRSPPPDHNRAPRDDNGVGSKFRELWNSKGLSSPPVGETVICSENHNRHLNTYALDRRSSPLPESDPMLLGSRFCPVLISKNDPTGPIIGWTVILPLCWVRDVWHPLITSGAHAIGFEEKHWIASDLGLPFFPMDFPDCGAHARLKKEEASASLEKYFRRPPKLRPFRVPILSPWNTVLSTFRMRFPGPSGGLLKLPMFPTSGNQELSSIGQIARDSTALAHFMEKVGGSSMLLPKQANGKEDLLEAVGRGGCRFARERGGEVIFRDPKPCFVRVSLRTFRKGSFEEGAVVCAPHLSDIATISSSGEKGELQISPSCAATYFEECCSGGWVVREPEAAVSQNTHRWPIGFVTSGFVRGCKRPEAVAVCEATLLSLIREDQWKAAPPDNTRPHLYVLVRNLRSTAYRLALLTLILEHHPLDSLFLP